MRAILRCEGAGCERWDVALLQTPIAGLPLLKRHLMAFREAGVARVEICCDGQRERLQPILEQCRVKGIEVEISCGSGGSHVGTVLEQRADTLVDPRLVSQLADEYRDHGGRVICVDRYRGNYPVRCKTPYSVGAPGDREARPATPDEGPEGTQPMGLELSSSEPDQATLLAVGRYYWHRIRGLADAREASEKVLLGAMKQTDGIYAQTNRRVSLRITKRLLRTRVTPNAVTAVTLLWSAAAGLLFAQGTYFFMVAGSLVSWFASMLDGVDGELSRIRFEVSTFGSWFEMVCDYLYFIFIFVGMGIGIYRQTGNQIWIWMGAGSAVGVILSFAVIAWMRKLHEQSGEVSRHEYGFAYQKTLEKDLTNPIHYFLRRCVFLATRAAMPYYIVIFSLLGLNKLLMVIIFVGTNLVWTLSAYVSRLFLSPQAHLKRDSS